MRYFKIPSVNIAEKVSRAFYKLMTPENSDTTTTHLFNWFSLNNGEVIIMIDELMKCPVFIKTITESTLTEIVTYLNNYLTNNQKTALKNYIRNNATAGTPIDLINLIPAALTEVDMDYINSHVNPVEI